MVATNRGYQTIIALERQVETLEVGVGGAVLSVITEAFTLDTTWIAPAGLAWVDVIAVAGGGSGAGAAATVLTDQMSAGSGGGAGEVLQRRFTANEITGPVPITIGGGGVAVEGSSGGGGGPTSFGALLSATGGTPGVFSGVFTVAVSVPGGRGGRFPTPPVTTQSLPGGHGGRAMATLNGIVSGGDGGYCVYGDPGTAPTADATTIAATAAPGAPGLGYGAGGSGAIARGIGQAAQFGGDGAPGVLFIFSHMLV